jgi:hypothetical protein
MGGILVDTRATCPSLKVPLDEFQINSGLSIHTEFYPGTNGFAP